MKKKSLARHISRWVDPTHFDPGVCQLLHCEEILAWRPYVSAGCAWHVLFLRFGFEGSSVRIRSNERGGVLGFFFSACLPSVDATESREGVAMK